MVSRRSFIVTGSAAVIAGSASVGSASRAVSGLGAAILEDSSTLNSDFFKSHLMSEFQIEGVNTKGPTTMRLIEVKEASCEKDPAGVKREGFSLLFEGSKRSLIPQESYRFTNPSFGSRQMFTVPVTSEKGIYEVTFNRLRA